MTLQVSLAAGYALLMWVTAWLLRKRAGAPVGNWVVREGAVFARVIALVPLAVAAVVLVGAAVWTHSTAARALLLTLLAAVAVSGWRGVVELGR